MSQDARNSLIALASVTLIVGVSVLFMWLMQGVELPRWTPYAVLGLNLLTFVVVLFRWLRERSLRKASAARN